MEKHNPKKCAICWTTTILVLLVPLLLGALVVWSFWPKAAHAAEGTATFYTTASCIAEGTSGVYTANRERYDEGAYTCALPNRKTMGKKFIVVNQDTGRSVVVRQNDIGPGRKARANGVIIDLTPAAFCALGGKLKDGKINVAVQEVKEQ